MKSALLLVLLSTFVIAVSCLPEAAEEPDQPLFPWYNSYSYQYMLCRLQCRQSCLEQGYWKGVCKQGACYCFGPTGPFPRMNSFPLQPY